MKFICLCLASDVEKIQRLGLPLVFKPSAERQGYMRVYSCE